VKVIAAIAMRALERRQQLLEQAWREWFDVFAARQDLPHDRREALRQDEWDLTRLMCEYDAGFKESMGGAKVAALALPAQMGQSWLLACRRITIRASH